MRLGVIGTGHVGLVQSASLAHFGHTVVGVDTDQDKIERLRAGEIPFYEPGLAELVAEGVEQGRLSFDDDVAKAVPGASAVFICVGTPATATGEANLVAVEQASREAVEAADGPLVVVEKSTVPAGTAGRIRRTIALVRPDLAHEIDVVSNPEFLREGRGVVDSLEPDRILVGAESERAFAVMREVYRPLLDRGVRVFETNIETAELAKHACNAFLSLKISFANALARMCERSGADVADVVDVMGADDRIGREFLNAGIGYGGYCFPKDVVAFERLASRLGYEFGLLREVERINHEAIDAAFDKVKDALWNMEDKRVALLGLSFKPDTDDVRFSPSLALARKLLDEGADVVGYDPQAGGNAKSEVPDLELASDPYEACRGAHCMILATDWAEFAGLDLERVRDDMAYPVVVDGRNLFDPATMGNLGFTYYPTGRPPIR